MRQHCVIIVTKINRVDLCCETAVKGSIGAEADTDKELAIYNNYHHYSDYDNNNRKYNIRNSHYCCTN